MLNYPGCPEKGTLTTCLSGKQKQNRQLDIDVYKLKEWNVNLPDLLLELKLLPEWDEGGVPLSTKPALTTTYIVYSLINIFLNKQTKKYSNSVLIKSVIYKQFDVS